MKLANRRFGLITDIFFVLLIVFIDQFTKELARASLRTAGTIKIIGNFVTFVYVENYGAGFGILQNFRWPLVFFSIFFLGLLIFYWNRIVENKVIHFSSVLIVAGILGNLIDRISLGYVTDFVSIWRWPVFNVADSSAFIGTMALLIYLMFLKDKKKKTKKKK